MKNQRKIDRIEVTSYACFFKFDSTRYKSEYFISSNDNSFSSNSRIIFDKLYNLRSNLLIFFICFISISFKFRSFSSDSFEGLSTVSDNDETVDWHIVSFGNWSDLIRKQNEKIWFFEDQWE